eukprot:TRINITY_DN689_c0_g1_i1.p1 TRINITY_DN689_c0_g1~~TRINITY_DN689_c0_g1_i1.p1  ORF type:complete len:182 (+),score=14.96 TRINITY_DN689_c0_g1_i1:315-860(+)
MLQWVIIFAFLVIEMVLCLSIILLPFSTRKKVLTFFARTWYNHGRVRIIVKTFLAMVFGFFVDSARSIYLVENIISEQPEMETKAIIGSAPQLNVRLFSSERNLFLTGATLFLFLILYRFMTTAITIMELEHSLDTEKTRSLHDKKEHHKISYEIKKLQEILGQRGIDTTTEIPSVGDSRE